MIDRSLLSLKLFYFVFFAAIVSLAPFLALYYEQIGLSGRQIGLLVGLPPLVSLFSASLFGAIADATQRHKPVLLLAVGCFALTVLGLSFVTDFGWLVPTIIVYAIFFAPILPLVDKTALDLLGNNKNQYGRQRLWGSIGWGVAAPSTGFLVEQSGLHWAFYICFGLLLLLLFVSWQLPVGQVSLGGPFWQGVRLLLTNWQWAIFLSVVFICGAALSISHNYLFLYLDELGAGNTLMGLSLTVAMASELVVLFYSDRLLRRWNTRGLLTVALTFLAVRLLAYAYAHSAGLVVGLQLLHGLTFGVMWVAGVARADNLAPPGLGATAQGLFAGVTMGLGAAFGAITGGFLYQQVGLASMFRWAGIGVLAALFLYFLAGRLTRNWRLRAVRSSS